MKAVSNQNSAVSRAKCLASVVFTDRIVNMPYLPTDPRERRRAKAQGVLFGSAGVA